MRKILFVIMTVSLFGLNAQAWNLSGSNQAEMWISQPGYSLSYKEMLDINLKGDINNGL